MGLHVHAALLKDSLCSYPRFISTKKILEIFSIRFLNILCILKQNFYFEGDCQNIFVILLSMIQIANRFVLNFLVGLKS